MALYDLFNAFFSGKKISTFLGTERVYAAVPGSPNNLDAYFEISDLIGSAAITDTPTSTKDDYSPSGYNAGTFKKQTIRLAGTTACGIHGLAGGLAGKQVTIKNVGDTLRWIANEAASSSAANRFTINDGVAFLMPGDAITFEYDGTSSRWEVLYWPNRGMSMGLSVFDDMQNFNALTTAASNGAGAGQTASAGGADGTQKSSGNIRLTSGTTATGRVNMGWASASASGVHIFPGNGTLLSVARLSRTTAPDGTDHLRVLTGFGDAQGGNYDDATNARKIVCWENRFNGTAEEWAQVTCNSATTVTRSTTGSPAAATVGANYYWFIVFINAAGTAADFIYGDAGVFTLSQRISTGLPTGTYSWMPTTIIKAAGTTARTVDVDLVGFRGNFGSRG